MNARARNSDPHTSHRAADSVANIRESQLIILHVLTRYGPLTDEEIYQSTVVRTAMSPSGARTRRKELVDKGLVFDSGETGTTACGRKTILWTTQKPGLQTTLF